jgi:exopolysaccharide biosynthesis polyprenyl glycosylphosphotransferase
LRYICQDFLTVQRPANRDIRFVTRKYLLAASDLVLLVITLLLYIKYFYTYDLWPRQTLIEHPGWYALLCALWIFYSNVFNLYNTVNAPRTFKLINRTVMVAMVTAVTYLLIPFLSPVFPGSRLPFFVFIALVVIVMTVWHVLFAELFTHPILTKRALVVGAGWSGQEIVRTLENKEVYHQSGYEVIGYIDDDPDKQGKKYEGIRVIGTSEDLFTYARRLYIDEIILATYTAKSINGNLYARLVDCESYGVTVTPVNLLYESVTGKVMVKESDDKFILTYDYHSKKQNWTYLALNRLLNIGFGVVGVVITLLFIPFVWLLNLMLSRGPLFYSQTRTGRDDEDFTIYKFRTMIVDAEKKTGAVWADKNDARITLPGKFYRKTRIDELPQFWNVLKGDMNLIGPRPERPMIVEELTKKISFFRTRHMVKPGITGWAQVRHKYGNTDEDALIKLQYDLYYIKYRSFLLDLNIIWQTVSVMLKFKGN